MKCLRCGQEVDDSLDTCPECGFSIKEQKEYQKIVIDDDSSLSKEEKTRRVDNPILTIIFGILTVLFSVMFFIYLDFVFLFLLLTIIMFVICFLFSLKPARIRLKPLREFGIILGFLGIGIAVTRLVTMLISLIFG